MTNVPSMIPWVSDSAVNRVTGPVIDRQTSIVETPTIVGLSAGAALAIGAPLGSGDWALVAAGTSRAAVTTAAIANRLISISFRAGPD
jgi:hypothetical protein